MCAGTIYSCCVPKSATRPEILVRALQCILKRLFRKWSAGKGVGIPIDRVVSVS